MIAHANRIDSISLAFFAGLMAAIFLTIAAYWPGINGPFLIDDMANVFTNTDLPDLSFASIASVLAHNESGPLGRPLSALSFALTRFASGDESFAFKYQNLMLHIICGLLLAWLTFQLLSQRPEISKKNTIAITLLACTLWLIHPLNLTTVFYTVQRMTQLGAIFSVASLICYAKGRADLDGRSSKGVWLMYLGTGCFAVIGILSKESAALIPAYIAVIEWCIFSQSAQQHSNNRVLRIFLLFFVVAPALASMLIYALRFQNMLITYQGIRDFTLGERLISEAVIVTEYLKQIVMPRLSQLTLFHDDFTPIRSFFDIRVLICSSFLGALLFAAIKLRQNVAIVAFGILWFFASHLLESTVLPLELVFEHRNYLATLGPLLAISWLLVNPAKSSISHLGKFAAALAIIIFASMTHGRAIEWGSESSMVSIAVQDHPKSTRALTMRAKMLLNSGQSEAARKDLEQIAALMPDYAGPVLVAILTYCASPLVPINLMEQAIQRLRHGKVAAPYTLSALDALTKTAMKGRCPSLNSSQLVEISEAAITNHAFPVNSRDQSYLLWIHARSLMISKQYQDGKAFFRRAYEQYPLDFAPLLELVTWQSTFKQFEEATSTIEEIARNGAMDFRNDLNFVKSELKSAKDMHLKSQNR